MAREPALGAWGLANRFPYLTSFNEWHEGHQFEPMKARVDLTAEERAVGYHNPERGSDRLAALTALPDRVIKPDSPGAASRGGR
jgi:hypothetical protein